MKNHMQFYIQNIKLRIKMETKRNFKKCFKMYIDNLFFFTQLRLSTLDTQTINSFLIPRSPFCIKLQEHKIANTELFPLFLIVFNSQKIMARF